MFEAKAGRSYRYPLLGFKRKPHAGYPSWFPLDGGSGRETVEDGAGRQPLLMGPFEPKKVRMTF